MANTPTSEIFKDRRVQIGAAVAALLVIAGGAFFVLNSGGGDGATDTASAPPPANPDPGAPGAVPGAPGAPAPGAPGSPATPATGAANAPGAKPGTAAIVADSWARAPKSFPGGGGDGTGAAGNPGAPGAPAAGGTPGKLPKPIQYGSPAALFRGDPFLSTQKFVVELPFAYQFVAPLRLASRPKPPVPEKSILTIEEQLGPIPRIPRRVAGVLYDGSVSAIMETGQPGPDADVRVIQPGSLVPSGVAGLADLTVSVITPTSVTLRADDGRTLNVPLSTLPRAIADALRQQAGQQSQQGAGGPNGFPGPGGAGDVPPGAGGPGGFRGGPVAAP